MRNSNLDAFFERSVKRGVLTIVKHTAVVLIFGGGNRGAGFERQKPITGFTAALAKRLIIILLF